jgi:ATP-dependent helicase/nuclease subunit A
MLLRWRRRAKKRVSTTVSKLFLVGQETLEWGEPRRRPADAAERERALDVRQSWVVEAPAGSGKTGLLIQRYMKLLAEESVEQLGQVLAITFTKKAAGEIRERVVEQLARAARGENVGGSSYEVETRALAEAVVEKDRRLGWGLLESPQRMNLKTIDSLCAQIAGAMPVLAGGGAGIAPVEEALPLYQAAARRTMLLLGGEDAQLNDALRLVLLHRDGNLAECERMLAEMLGLREQWGELIPLGTELSEEYLDGVVLPRLERTLEDIVGAGLEELAERVPGDFLERLAGLASVMARNVPYKDVSPIAVCAGRGVPGTSADDLEHWRALIHLMVVRDKWTWRKGLYKHQVGFETTKEERAVLREVLELIANRDDLREVIERVAALPEVKYPPEQWVVAKALFRLLSRALVELQLVFAERGECDFAELSLRARGALRQEGGVFDLQEALGLELRHLLVDEMQDTSTSQYKLIQLLTQGWDGQSQTVFLVGDPKQSIYLFRQARVERFLRTMEEQRLGDMTVLPVRLTANFRSQERLVEAFNEDFALLFPRGGEVEYGPVEAECGRADAERGVHWHTRLIDGKRNSEEVKKAHREWLLDEAREVRRIAEEWRARPLPEGRKEPWKIAVLVQNRRHLVDIVAALKGEDGGEPIPYTAVKIDALGERQEVMDLLALTRALLHPADRPAWLAVLRAPWCGLSLVDLHAVAGGDDPEMAQRCIPELMVEREGLLSAEGRALLRRARGVMEEVERQRGRVPNAELVERVWRSLGGDVSLGAEELENARRYLKLLEEMEAGTGRVDVSQLQRRMERLYAESAQRPGAVELVTIHGAKGLEWDVVMVPGLERRTGGGEMELLVWDEVEEIDREAAHGMLAPIRGKGEKAKKLNGWLKGLRRGREEAERKRLFYVACTRAREELHVFAAPGRKGDGSITREPKSLLKAAWQAAERYFADAARRPGELLPFVRKDEVEGQGLQIAAGAEMKGPVIERLPLSFNPAARFRGIGVAGDVEDEGRPLFERPEGSFAARAFGNAVHGFLDLAARRLRDGASAEGLLSEVAGWAHRVEAVLRSEGLAPAVVRRESQRVIAALQTALGDVQGRWLLGSREGAESEFGFTTWAERRKSFRLDRVFVGGREPMAEGSECLWIVDYKTAGHGRGEGLEEFLAEQRTKYEAQLESYARAMTADAGGRELRVGLYYPLLPKLLWWRPEVG